MRRSICESSDEDGDAEADAAMLSAVEDVVTGLGGTVGVASDVWEEEAREGSSSKEEEDMV